MKIVSVAALICAALVAGQVACKDTKYIDSDLLGIAGFSDSQERPIQHLISKLELYAQGYSDRIKLTIELVRDARDEWHSWDKGTREFMLRRCPLVRLLVNVAINLVDKMDKEASVVTPEMEKLFLNEMYLGYKSYRHAYFGKMLGEEYASTPHMDRLMDGLRKRDAPQITAKMVDLAIKEYETVRSRMRTIETNGWQLPDVVKRKGPNARIKREYEKIFNTLNRLDVRVLVNNILQNYQSELLSSKLVKKARMKFIAETSIDGE